MAALKIEKDEFLPDGTRLFNPTRPHGTVYADGFSEAKWVQDDILYRGDRRPLNYVPKAPETKNAGDRKNAGI